MSTISIQSVLASLHALVLPPAQPSARNMLGSSAALGVLILMLRWLSARGATAHQLIGDPGKVGRPVKSREDEYDPEEYDVIVVGGVQARLDVFSHRVYLKTEIHEFCCWKQGRGICIQSLSRNELFSRVPALFPQAFCSEHDHNIYTVPQKHAGFKCKYWPRGKMLGGCSSVNAMMFHHCAPSDYNEWAALQKGKEGAEGWSYQQMHKYFMKFEKYHPNEKHPSVDVSLRGSSGPVNVGYFGHVSVLTPKFIEACHNAGVSYNPDLNTSKGTMGVTETATYIDSRRRRVTTETAYLTAEVLERENLTVATGAKVLRLLFEYRRSGEEFGPRVKGVQYANDHGNVFEVKARKEVVISFSSFRHLKILLLSGIGPADHLAVHGIPSVADLPGVGAHLMDHASANLYFMDKSGADVSAFTVHDIRSMPGPSLALKLARAALDYVAFGTGMLSGNIVESLAFARSDDPTLFPHERFPPNNIPEDTTSGPDAPDIEIVFTPVALYEHGVLPFPIKGHHFSLLAILLRPTSLGTVRLKSADPYAAPVIDPANKKANRPRQTEPFASLIDPAGDDIPLLNHRMDRLSDTEVETLVRDRVQTVYHPTSTARMAPLEDGGVVDPFLRVHGVPNLRVVDASVFPTIPSGHTVRILLILHFVQCKLIFVSVKVRTCDCCCREGSGYDQGDFDEPSPVIFVMISSE
ncbi:GMC oxidoreductase-like protein [Postia placenta Mad-698-R]|uniref:Glucose-methanol-choline oxidoreductase N-terminal domain-containing protein n=1 Tax=Postia placenta MAD-698-R-SB12 TaxID=670580 RepID=A0A1X6MTI8_9APHY|nr:hypothetical protein POSPLADRAFT_1048889 [Postia placenta MAD-698-R-SB12]EED79286.1 GMC oxidoreductase-like protein [Postia placenta Mad-698-R]OSX59580.1 hypothetical protein POSPLADRAFT_1048889 [Postia placenta MAD-698-R-SB12]